MDHDYLPQNDGDLTAWAENFVTYAAAHSMELGLAAADLSALADGYSAFKTALAEHVAVRQAAQAARQTKDDRRYDFKQYVRRLVRRLQASDTVSDHQRQALGITVADKTPTAAGPINTRPVGAIDTGQRLEHAIRFSDEMTPTRRGKPKGTLGCEIWVKLAAPGEPPPRGPEEMRFVALVTARMHRVAYDGTDGGKTAHYMLRWVKKGPLYGPWSETISATVAL